MGQLDKNQLPPELVEKMVDSVINGFVLEKTSYRIGEQCAQIAVEYSHEVTVALSYSVTNLSKQRDELLDFVREVMETTSDKIRYDKAKQLINKIYGK